MAKLALSPLLLVAGAFAQPVFFQEWFSRYSKTGTVGDPTRATKEKGEKFVKAVADRMVALLGEFRAREIQARVDHH